MVSVDIGTNLKTGSKIYLAGGYENYKTWYKIYPCKITELIDHGSVYHCNKWVLIVSTYYINIEAGIEMI